jgi:catechol 2,3-dioxygenase-like lactoylglutathione lyase family enzyme
MTLRLGMVQISVTDLDEAWRFYVERLGIPGKRRFGPGKAFELDLEGGPAVLVYPATQKRIAGYPDESAVTLVFHTPNLPETLASWKAKGVEFVGISWAADASGIAESPFGPFIAFRDPFGNVHELLQPR